MQADTMQFLMCMQMGMRKSKPQSAYERDFVCVYSKLTKSGQSRHTTHKVEINRPRIVDTKNMTLN